MYTRDAKVALALRTLEQRTIYWNADMDATFVVW
jgi:hypothetical protein